MLALGLLVQAGQKTLLVEVLYNGLRLGLPGCENATGLCTLEDFLVS